MADTTQAEHALKALYEKMYAGMVGKDRSMLDAALDPSFTLTHMTGMRQSKERFICAIEDGTLDYFSVWHESVTVDVRDDAAALIGDSLVEAAVFGGGKGTWRLRLTMRAVETDGAWQFISADASAF